MTSTLPLGFHIAHLDPMTGVGLLVCPPPGADVDLPEGWEPEPVHLRIGSEMVLARSSAALSVHHADYLAACRTLARSGWHVRTEDSDRTPATWGGVLHAKRQDGSELVLLHHDDPIMSSVGPADLGDSPEELGRLAGLD